MHYVKFLLPLLLLIGNSIFAQSTYEQVHNILTTKCSPTCHGNDTYSFNINDPLAALYDSLLNAEPKNTFAVNSNYKLISPGYPDRSYLLRKVANCISNDLALHSMEGTAMPENEPPLLNEEIELIRQWILFGAPDTGTVVDKNLIDSYYQNGTLRKIEQPTPPKSCEGFQIHFGPIFYAPREETEYFQRYDLNLADTLEVIGFASVQNVECHHFGIGKYIDSTAVLRQQGLVTEPLDAMLPGDKVFVGFSRNGETFMLPNGTAYLIRPDESLDLNFHLFNPYNEIMVAEAYVNVYTQPKGSASMEVKGAILHNSNFAIPNDSLPHTFNYSFPIDNISITSLSSHTHKHGVDFDIYLRNSDGSKGLMIYNGSYNYLQGFDTGIYNWEHPPVAFYDPLLDLTMPINNGTVPEGLIMEVTYVNTGADTLYFGITTQEEMMAILIQYIEEPFSVPSVAPYIPQCTETYRDPCKNDSLIDGIVNTLYPEVGLHLYPNPSQGETYLAYKLDKPADLVRLEIVNILGETISLLVNNEQQPIGEYNYQLDGTTLGAGIYFARLSINGQNTIQKLIVAGN